MSVELLSLQIKLTLPIASLLLKFLQLVISLFLLELQSRDELLLHVMDALVVVALVFVARHLLLHHHFFHKRIVGVLSLDGRNKISLVFHCKLFYSKLKMAKVKLIESI